MSKRLEEIIKKNAEFKKESPYNYCDRWCEYCRDETQARCKVYQDEFEQKITCIAYGKELDDAEIFNAIMEKKYENLKGIEDKLEELDIDFEAVNEPEFEKIKQHIKFVENNPLQNAAGQYLKKAHKFLEKVFYKNEFIESNLGFDFKIVSWYHTLLSVKLNRALAGFHESSFEDDFVLCDAVAQFQICKKAIKRSIEALGNIKNTYNSYGRQILELIALLGNIQSRIIMLEESV